jgi:ATP-dependent DNA helicase RecG
MRWLRRFDDAAVHRDLRLLMIVDMLVWRGWIDTEQAARRLQVSAAEAHDSLNRMVDIGFEGGRAMREVDGTPTGSAAVYVLDVRPLAGLAELDSEAGWRHNRPLRKAVALDYAIARGRISTTELGSLVDAAPTNVGAILRSLERRGPARAVPRGPARCGVLLPLHRP